MPYFDMNLNLSWEDQQLKETAHEFARDVMRPIAKELDQMNAVAAIAPESPLWDFMRQAYGLGFHAASLPEEVGGQGLTPLQVHILQEELAWGSHGLATTLGVAGWPFLTLAMSGNQELIEKYVVPFVNCTDGSIAGCWGGTEPNRGSDYLANDMEFFSQPGVRADCTAVLDGDEYVINGSKCAWVSIAPIASHVQLHLQIDSSMGLGGQGCFFLPLDLPGVSKGPALEKLGLRDLCQGELFFDNVRVPKSSLLLGTDQAVPFLEQALTKGNMTMGVWATGLARAAYDEALNYARERVQGGKPIIEHETIKIQLHKMFSRVEACRALSRAVINLNGSIFPGHPEYSFASKTVCTQMALENASDAIQVHGGYGLTKEYNTEKWFRDARATQIADGMNGILNRKGGDYLNKTYPRLRTVEAK
jgi:alkylation response protein AidB-like acyl-CoA dehydrogenase